MNKDKIKKLLKYQAKVKEQLGSNIPDKHRDRPDAYKAFLQRELETVTRSIVNISQTSVGGDKL